ncbi:MAG: trypsin-like peptidase domain-containing protein [bacterium]
MRHKSYLLIFILMIPNFILRESGLLAQSASDKNSIFALNTLSGDFEALSERVSPSVVQIFAMMYVPVQAVGSISSNLLTRQRSSGSGVILDPDGYIITNAHVVEGARRLQVVLAASSEDKTQGHSILKARGKIVGAQIVGIDRETDLAVLKIQEKNLPFLQLGDSDELRQGQLVLAFGSPLGLENTVTLGVISSIARQFLPEDPMIYIQTDAPINPGNSGGPLVDTNGRVVGINTLIFTQSGGSEGIGFAAPSNIVRNVFEQIRNTGRVRRGVIGAHAQTITPTLAAGLGLPQNWGVVLGDVYPDGPADKAGLKVGDVILTLDGKVMENGRQFDVNLYRRSIGDLVTLELLRGTQKLTVQVSVIEREDDPERFAELVSPERNLIPKLGILGIELDSKIAKMLPPLRKATGVVVATRSADAPYWQNGLLPGDVIYSINGDPIAGLVELRSAIANLKVFDPVVVQVERRGQLMFIAFELE